MVSPISSAPPTQPVAKSSEAPAPKPAPSKPQAAAAVGGGDSVHLSSTAQALLAAMQEATETPFQTAKEASGGDPQAQRLLANESAARVADR